MIDANDHNRIATRAEVNIRLTDKGFERWEYVYQAVFSYIEMMQKMSSEDLARIFQEVKSIEESNWLCQEEPSPTRNVTSLSRYMALYPVKNWLRGKFSLIEFH